MSSVTLPRSVLIALVAVLLACLGVTAFLAGRASAPAAPVGATPPPAAQAVAPYGALPPPAQAAPAQPAPLPLAAGVPAARPEAAPAGVVPSLAPAAPAEAARVARYFQEMETAQASAKYWSDPQALAGSLVEGLGKGDRSGVDQLIDATRGALDRMKAIDVPVDCAEHHRRSLDLVEQGVGLLTSIANGVTQGDAAALANFAGQARQLETDAKDVDALATRIKQRYGLG
jgi:hypothetical protein